MPIQTPICDFGQKAHDFKLKSTDKKILSLEDVKGENGTLIKILLIPTLDFAYHQRRVEKF